MSLFRKKDIVSDDCQGNALRRCLSGFDLMLLGIGAIIGAGIFVLTGVVAATKAGPAIVISYIIAGLACLFSALSYAELATVIGGCGGAYGYAYVGFGEIIAWVVGWDLLLEYSITISTVAVGWSSYVKSLLQSMHLNMSNVIHLTSKVTIDVFALGIISVIGGLLIFGVRSSTRFNNIIVGVKLLVILLFVIVASMHIEPSNWSPFMPFGWMGVAQGASLIFFAYIGFDAVSTTAEEVVNPQRNLPIGIVGSLSVSTLLYIIIAGLLTGMVSYKQLNVASPISDALLSIGFKAAAGVVSVGALAGLTTGMLVLSYGLSRIFYAIARDGLLPTYFAKVNDKTHTPVRIIVLCVILMGLISSLLPISILAQLLNIGTLVAFTVVCTGVLILYYTRPDLKRPFRTPCMPYVPIMGIITCIYLIANLPMLTLMRFVIWFIVGMTIYFAFGRKNSALEIKKRFKAAK
ncbi:MAG: amino acid permease [Gammaproteobacteria bacterium]|nr:amino acid permease [Gammaproteobacteria bacterium]